MLMLSGIAAGAQNISTIAGGSIGDGRIASNANLYQPRGIAVDGAGNVYIADTGENRVRKVSAGSGTISTIAGNGIGAFGGDGGPAINAQLNQPRDLVVDSAGNLYIADTLNYRIRKVTPGGIISTFAGNGNPGFNGDGIPAVNASISIPSGLAIDAAGNLVVADTFNNRIRRISAAGSISTIAGTGVRGYNGDGILATAANLNRPQAVAFDAAGNMLIADTDNNRVRMVFTNGGIGTIAGNGVAVYGGDGGPASSAGLRAPRGLAVDAAGNVFIADFGNQRIRRLSPGGIIDTVVGNGSSGLAGDGIVAALASLNGPNDIAFDAAGNMLFSEGPNARVRRVTAGVLGTIAGGGSVGDGGPAVNANMPIPQWMVYDAAGNLYVSDSGNNSVRKITPAGIISTIAGTGVPGYSGDGGAATSAQLRFPYGLAFDRYGNLYIGDSGNFSVRRVEAGSGLISTVAGTGVSGPGGENVLASTTPLGNIYGIAIDGMGNLYMSDFVSRKIRRMAPGGLLNTIAGTGNAGYSGDGGPAINADLSDFPAGLAVDAANNLYLADSGNSRIRKINLATGIISTVAGSGNAGYNGDGMLATAADLNGPEGIGFDAQGNMYIGDSGNNRVRKVDGLSGIISTVVGNGNIGFAGDGGPAVNATLNYPQSMVFDRFGNMAFADTGNARIRYVQFVTPFYYVTPSAGLNGSITPNTTRSVTVGSTATFTLTPDNGYKAVVSGSCGGTLVGDVFTTNPITGDCTVEASFQHGNKAKKPKPSK